MKKTITLLLFFFSISSIFAQQNVSRTRAVEDFLTSAQWDQLFPNRAGTTAGHPQGYTTDFYSYNNLKTAITEMGDYLVKIRKKPGVWGELITITRKSTNTTYNYSQVDSWWYTNSTPEVVIDVDFADFVNRSNVTNNKRELAAFLANISKETTGGWQTPVGGGSQGDYAKWGLYFVHEVGYTAANGAGAYSQASTDYPPNPSKGYYGRGPIQLSWNYNYGQFSKFLYNDASVLLNNPDLVQQDGVLALKSAIWFWMMPQWPKPSCHQVMHELWVPNAGEYTMPKMYLKGFAHTNNIINGGLECRNTSTSIYTAKVVLRSELYKYYLGILGFTTAQITAEDSGDYTTICYQSSSSAMQDYQSANVLTSQKFDFDNFSFSPNPTNDFLKISYSQEIDQIQLYTLSGQLVKDLKPKASQTEVRMTDLSEGIYIVQVTSNNESVIFKIVKK
ncbi:MAG: glycoside hydrolase family 19 protein [Limnohabitans sp.]|nr:glycoside hydrolase family 19 protein [Limnohabitans sp.]